MAATRKSKSSFNSSEVSLGIIAAVAATAALIYTRPVLVPFVISLFLYAIASPSIVWLQVKGRIPRGLAIGLVGLAVFSAFFGLVIVSTNSIQDFIASADRYRNQFAQSLSFARDLAEKFGFELDVATLQAEVANLPVFSIVKNITGNVASLFGNAALVMISFAFLLFGDQKQFRKNAIARETMGKVSRYAATKLSTSLATGVFVTVVLAFFRVDLAFMFGLFTFFLNFIPSVGSIIATLLPVPVLLLQFGLSWQCGVILAICGLVQFVIGNVLEPRMMGESLDLHPITVLFFLLFWGLVWGIPGMFLAVPITAIVKIVLERMPGHAYWQVFWRDVSPTLRANS